MGTPGRILITGVGGFVGLHLTRRIVERGGVALGLGIEPAPASIAGMLAGEWRADVEDLDGLAAALREARPGAIVHVAAQSRGAMAYERPVETYRVNAVGTMALLDAVRREAPGARVLVAGTGEVYGPQPEGSRVGEDALLRPVTPYALSKAAADTLAAAFAGWWDLDVVRTRSFAHVGPGQSDRFLVPSLARQLGRIAAGRQEPIVKVGNLDVTRDFADVRDVVEAYLALLEHGRRGAAYNVCRGEGTRLSDLARRMCERAAVDVTLEVDPGRLRPADLPYLVGDPTAIERDTGWRASRPLDRAIDEVLEEWHGKSLAESRSSRQD